jgi:hypothetical protein
MIIRNTAAITSGTQPPWSTLNSTDEKYTSSMNKKKVVNSKTSSQLLLQTLSMIRAIKSVVTSITLITAVPVYKQPNNWSEARDENRYHKSLLNFHKKKTKL